MVLDYRLVIGSKIRPVRENVANLLLWNVLFFEISFIRISQEKKNVRIQIKKISGELMREQLLTSICY